MSNSYDAHSHEAVIGVPTFDDLERWGHGPSEFIRSEAGISEPPFVWLGKRPLGKGSFGLAGLWEKIDGDGNVVDSMVIKQIGPRRDGSWNAEKPQEVRIMEKMNKTGTPGAVELRSYRRYTVHMIHRIYMEYCPYGDLRRLYKQYRKFRRYLPEQFLWEVFYYLTEVCAAMEHGPPDAPWDYDIVHRDIKPANVFLGIVNSREHPLYPVAKLGDWGMAVQTSVDDPQNPLGLVGCGSRRYMAPEQLRRDEFPRFLYTGTNRYLSSYTNIWAVGATMYELLTLHSIADALFEEEIDIQGTIEGLPPITTVKDPEYSDALRSLIRDCLRPRADDRPGVAGIQARIGEYRRKIADDLNQKRTDKSIPPDEEWLYYRGKEIETMTTGNWEPSSNRENEGWEGPESGFEDPDYTPIRYPDWGDDGGWGEGGGWGDDGGGYGHDDGYGQDGNDGGYGHDDGYGDDGGYDGYGDDGVYRDDGVYIDDGGYRVDGGHGEKSQREWKSI